jgi:phosphoribosyl-AMP cyclohydrolase
VFAPRFDAEGYLPVIVTAAKSGEVLMLAYMNAEALARTIETAEAHYWSRSRGRLWRKGEESGNTQRVVEMRTDCDQDAIWLKVEAEGAGAACHTGRRTCFYRAVPLGGGAVSLSFVDAERQFDPEAVYRHSSAANRTLKSSE